MKYSPHTTNVTVIDTELPSDPNDPGRKNNVKPVDVPKEKILKKKEILTRKN